MGPQQISKSDRFLSCLEPLQRQLAGYCARALNHPDETSDTLQAAVGHAFEDFDRYAEGTNFRAWIYRYVSYEVWNRNRAAARRPQLLSPAAELQLEAIPIRDFCLDQLLEDPETVLDQMDTRVSQAVAELNEAERRILLLRAVGEFKYREIADILEIPLGTVMGLLSRARQHLRLRLTAYARQQGLISRGESA